MREIGFLLLPDFSMLSLAATVEPLRMANRLAATPLYDWPLYAVADEPVPASNGMRFAPTRYFSDADGLHALFVVAGYGTPMLHSRPLMEWLRQLARSGITLGSTSTGSLLLAHAGVLTDRRCTIHWENADGFQEEFPRLHVTNELFEVDGNVMTCSGGVAGLDMMLQIITADRGEELATAVAEQCIHPSIRPAHAAQQMSLQNKHRITNRRLLRAVELMRAHLEEPITCETLASDVGVSTRHLERLFRAHFASSPTDFYMELRLDKAHNLLHHSTLTILEVASACGFSSSSYFSRRFRRHYGCSPTQMRQPLGKRTPVYS